MTCLYCGERIDGLSSVRGVEISYLDTGGQPRLYSVRYASKDVAADKKTAAAFKSMAVWKEYLKIERLQARFKVFGLSPSPDELKALIDKTGEIIGNPMISGFHPCCNRF